jgi:cell filamentation protein
VRFADPQDIQKNYALKLGQDKAYMAANPGTVMGYLAYGHPFLDGNGRTIMVIHCVLSHRAGISVDWASTSKTEYLTALTHELNDPDKGHLDVYLKSFVGNAHNEKDLLADIVGAPGLDGEGEDRVAGNTGDTRLKAEYEAEKLKRKEAFG